MVKKALFPSVFFILCSYKSNIKPMNNHSEKLDSKTSWSKIIATYPSFDDYIIIKNTENNNRLLIRPEEFNFLLSKMHDNWVSKKSNYVQILEEWNENKGFYEIDEQKSIIKDLDETIKAIELIVGVKKIEFGKLTQEDLKLILDFLKKNMNLK